MIRIRRFPDSDALARAGAEQVLAAADQALDRWNRFHLVLSGGRTPRALYQQLAELEDRLDWSRVRLFWGDERCVPPEDPASNYRMVRETLLGRIAIPPDRIHRIPAELEPAEGARRYETELQALSSSGSPLFDLVLLGLGNDGHTASLFPGSPALGSQRRVEPTRAPDGTARISLTPAGLNSSEAALFLVDGGGKREPLARILAGRDGPDLLPPRAIQPVGGRIDWLVHLPEPAGT